MSYKEIMNDKNRSVLDAAIATKILQHMDRVRNNSHEGQARRWVWELIQNAKDCAYPGQPVSIKIELFPDRLEFSHNGRAFEVKSLLSIVNQVSSKAAESEETTGKFGTGFVTTHLLSEKVHLSSVIQDFHLETGARLPMKHFELELDRSGKNQDDILSAVRRAVDVLEHLDESPHAYVDLEEFNTTFTYDLSSVESKRIAKTGLADLEFSAAYVLAFVPGIAEISVIDHVMSVRKELRRGQEKTWGETNVSTFTLLVRENGVARHEYLLLTRHEKTVLAMPVDAEGGNLLEISSKTPRIFSDFPLIGAEGFPFPVVCHHSGFRPDETRSIIPVVDSDLSTDSLVNKEILLHGMLLYKELLIVISGAEYGDFFHGVTFPAVSSRSNLDETWVRTEILEKMYDYLREIPLIQTEQGLSVLHDGFYVPVSTDEEEMGRLWSIMNQLEGISLPLLSEALGWCKGFLQYTDLMQKHSISLKNLAEGAAIYPLKEDCTFLSFVQMIYDVVMLNPVLSKEVYSGNLALFPDQTSEMKLHTSLDIFVDVGLEEPIKQAILELNQIDWFVDNEKYKIYELLLHSEFRLGDMKVVREAPVDKYFQYVRKKLDCSERALGFVKEQAGDKLHRIGAAGYLVSSYHDGMWLDVYKKCIDPSFELEHCPSNLAQPKYWEMAIRLVMFQVGDMISKCGSLDKFKRGYFPDEEGHIEWLKLFLEKSCLISDDIYNFSVFPNQYGVFQTAYMLKNDGYIDVHLKDIAKLLAGEQVRDYYKLLISPDFPRLEYIGITDLTNDDIARDITRGINYVLNHHNLSEAEEKIQEACTLLLAWLEEYDELAEELFGQFYSSENRMKLLTPKSAAILNRKVQEFQKVITDFGLKSVDELASFLEESTPKETSDLDHIYEDEDIYIDFHEHPELYELGVREREAYRHDVGLAGEQFALDMLMKKWETIGYEKVPCKDPRRVIYQYLDKKVELFRPDTDEYKQSGWDISETVSGEETVYYEVKATVSQQRKNAVKLSHAQADCAFVLGERYTILRFFLSVDFQSVISHQEINHLLVALREKDLFFTGDQLTFWLQD